MQVGKSVPLWGNASFQKHGNASLEISAGKCEQIYWWGAVGGGAAAAILRHGSAAWSPTTFNRLALSLEITWPAISDEIFDQQFFS